MNLNINTTKKNQGFLMLELLVSIFVATVLLLAFIALISQSTKLSKSNTDELKADLYARELIEIAKDLEQSNWNGANGLITSGCVVGNVCYPHVSGSVWVLNHTAESPTLAAGFTRSIYLEQDPSNVNKYLVTARVNWGTASLPRVFQLQTNVYKLP